MVDSDSGESSRSSASPYRDDGTVSLEGKSHDAARFSHSTGREVMESDITHLNHQPEHSQDSQFSRNTSSRPKASKNVPEEKVTWMSLPHKPQLFILALCRLSEPLSNTCLLPYLYYLIRSLQPASPDTSPNPTTNSRVSAASISKQAGLLVALFALAQFATSMPWSYIANRWGRKTSVMIGLSLSIISNLGFGFSKSIPSLFLWRALAGIGNGNIGVMRTMTAEIVRERKYQSRAFLLLPLVFNAGNVVGLALGGWLAMPVVNLPFFFGKEGVFNFGGSEEGVRWMVKYPFALPTICNAVVLMGSLCLAITALRETGPGLEGRRDYGLVVGKAVHRVVKRVIFRRKEEGYTIVHSDDSEPNLTERGESAKFPPSHGPPTISTTEKNLTPTWTKQVFYTLISFALLPLHNAAFMNVFPIFLSTPPSTTDNDSKTLLHFTGGLGLPSPTIGLYLSAFGIFGIAIQMLIYPALQARLSTLGAYKLALGLFIPAYIFAPYLSLSSNSHALVQGMGICAILFVQVAARTFAIPSSVILLTNCVERKKDLATVHGAGNMVSSLARAVGPAVAGWVYGVGVEKGMVGLVWWVYLAVMAGVGWGWSWWLRDGVVSGVKVVPGGGRGGDVEMVDRGPPVGVERERYRDEK